MKLRMRGRTSPGPANSERTRSDAAPQLARAYTRSVFVLRYTRERSSIACMGRVLAGAALRGVAILVVNRGLGVQYASPGHRFYCRYHWQGLGLTHAAKSRVHHSRKLREPRNEARHMTSPAPPAGGNPWRLIFRIVRWSTYACAAVTLLLVLHKAPAPQIETSLQAAARVEQKFEDVQQAVNNGQPATMRMDQTELNSYLASHLEIPSNPPATAAPAPAPSANPNPSTPGASDSRASAMPAPSGSTEEQIQQVQSTVKDVKVELVEDRARAYVVFDFHGKELTLQLEGKLGAQDGYLQFEPVSGQIGSLPIPQSTLEAAVRRMMESPENREKLKLPTDMSGLKIENGEVVATYK
jgi:hypothetical protein